MKHIAVFRFSALGDVAMTIPVVESVARQHPETTFTFVSRPFVAPLFASLPGNVRFFGADVACQYRGARGLNKLFRELRAKGIDAVADLHDVLRTKYLRTLFKITGTPTARVDKGRDERRRLLSHTGESFRPLRPMTERYADVFRALGLDVTVDFGQLPCSKLAEQPDGLPGKREGDLWIGIAPFAAHAGKVYPPERTMQAADLLLSRYDTARVFIFGSRRETAMLEEKHPGETRLVYVPKLLCGLGEEVELMRRLDAMLSMDSANMHLASLVQVPVVSVWGATHPFTGFMGYGQSERNAIQRAFPCRPCSVFGDKPCRFGDYRCLASIGPEDLVQGIENALRHGRNPK